MIPAEKSHLQVSASSHPGMSGKNNEDRYSVTAFRLEDSAATPSILAIVADGIGGHRAGEIAAEYAVETINRYIAESDTAQPLLTLHQAIQFANQKIYAEAESDPQKKGMGATCACCWIIDSQLYTASLGDSRIYLLRSGTLQQISTDHTWIQSALESGVITPEEVKGHTHTHVILRYLGSQNVVEPDSRMRLNASETNEQSRANQGLQLLPGDQLLICSDGLTDLVENDEIRTILMSSDSENVAQDLINLANQRGGHDNITVVKLVVPPPPHQNEPAPSTKANSSIPCLVSILVFLVILIVALIAVFFIFFRPL
jgi:protein phosphatase